MLTVACVFVQGPVAYTADYVVRLQRMVQRYLLRPHRFVCLTDQPWLFADLIETIPTHGMTGVVPENGAGYWTKVKLFEPLRFSGRVLYLDLDTLVVGDLSPIVDFRSQFALTEDALVNERAHLDRDRYGRKLLRRFNSSVMVWDAGVADDIYTFWSRSVSERLSTDQDWIAERHPEAHAMPLAWFPRISQTSPPWPSEAKVVLVKKPKNHEAKERWNWFDAWWGQAEVLQ